MVVDCSLMNEKGWEYLFSHSGSPLNDESGTIYFQNFYYFPDEYRKELLAAISYTDISRRLRLIFSCVCSEGQTPPETVGIVMSRLGCLTLRLPALRTRADEIPSHASLYLSNLNMEMGKQIIGFDPGAAELLMHYEWPNNTQFKQVLTELATRTDSAYIRHSTVLEVLSRERSLHRHPASRRNEEEFMPRTLEEITKDAIEQTVEAFGGNQTAAARQLGISRTTLWRYLSSGHSR